MKKILLVGAGVGQLSLAQKIAKRDVELVVVCYHALEEISSLAERVYYHDLFDLEGVLEIARKERIDAVISDQHDLYIPTVAYIAEKMGIPGNTYKQVMAYCDKNSFRDTCEECGVPVPRHIKVSDGTHLAGKLGFPVMVKPADSQSSVGISKVETESCLAQAIEVAVLNSRTKTAIVEEFFPGRELVSEGIIYRGKYYNLALADRTYFLLPDKFIPSKTLFPANVPGKILSDIIGYESKLAEKIKPSFAIVHTEWLWNEKDNKLACVESALRGGGVFISSHIIPNATGLDINDLLIDFALGKDLIIEEFLSKRKNKASGYVCFYLPKGRIKRIEGVEELRNLAGVDLVYLNNLKIGEHTAEMTHKGQRLGPIIVHAESRDSLEAKILECQKTLDIKVETDSGIVRGPIWD